jgi:hypothetical protein
MRPLLIFALCAWLALAQSNQGGESNMSCVERLQVPVYPPLARAARIRGSVEASVLISADVSIQTTSGAHILSPSAVEKAIRASTFRKTCNGKSVTLIFNFVLGEELDRDRLPQRVSFGYPNRFWISAPPQVIETQP